MMELLANPSLKRAMVGALAAGLIALNKKFGLDLDMGDVGAIAAIAVAFMTQSAMKEVKLAGINAAAKVETVPQAVDAINKAAAP